MNLAQPFSTRLPFPGLPAPREKHRYAALSPRARVSYALRRLAFDERRDVSVLAAVSLSGLSPVSAASDDSRHARSVS